MWDARACVPPFLAGLATVALIASFAVTVVPAATLDQQTCDQLKIEIAQLEALGARENLSKGAVWGKANLRSAQLEQVKKLIEMDEAVAFRCPRPMPQPDPAAAVQAKGKAPAKGGTKAKSAQEKVLPKPKPRPKAQAQAQPDSAAGSAAPPKPRPKAAAPKPSNDAFVPAQKAAPAQ